MRCVLRWHVIDRSRPIHVFVFCPIYLSYYLDVDIYLYSHKCYGNEFSSSILWDHCDMLRGVSWGSSICPESLHQRYQGLEKLPKKRCFLNMCPCPLCLGTWLTQFLGVTSGWSGVTITKSFLDILLDFSGLFWAWGSLGSKWGGSEYVVTYIRD